jgi:hypothetical protein
MWQLPRDIRYLFLVCSDLAELSKAALASSWKRNSCEFGGVYEP